MLWFVKEENQMNLTDLKVTAIVYPDAKYQLGAPVKIVDEGSFYRIDGTHIFDKFKIKEVCESEGRIEIKMMDKTVTLEIKQ